MPERIVQLTQEVSQVAKARVKDIQEVTRRTKIIAINAMVEAARIGSAGKGFSVVAQEVGEISEQINGIANDLQDKLSSRVKELDTHGKNLVAHIRGARLIDLSTNMIDIIDRNLYERSCDVRWWASDIALVQALEEPGSQNSSYASDRLSTILRSYTVYLDIWILNTSGQVIAHGAPDKYPSATTLQASSEKWFQEALRTRSGQDYAVADIAKPPIFNQTVATYATAIRQGGRDNGASIGVIAVFFDWQKQAQAVVDNVRIAAEEKSQSRCMILDANYKVIASSDRKGELTETFPLRTEGVKCGNYHDGLGHVIGFSQTSGYETYAGLGWYGAIQQTVGDYSTMKSITKALNNSAA